LDINNILPFQGEKWNWAIIVTQGVAVGLGYKWFSTICRNAPKVQYIPAQSQRVGAIFYGFSVPNEF